MRTTLAVISFLFFSSCGLQNSYYLYRNYEKDLVQTQTIGSPMIQTTVEFKNDVYGTILQRSQSELLYSGKSGDVIKIVYREYSNDIARPAFSQELQYDLKESNVIKFRRTTIEVIKATNQEITYKVLESPNFAYPQGKLTKQQVEQMR
ncbi:MAG: hypothetical protein HBSIN02_25520 [Bacteroidia bacterium]|nr:MAG: hypothetical protein HBSIN02_25520 [Bacteroidia bacterium]